MIGHGLSLRRKRMIAELLLSECDLRSLRNESLLFPFWAFASHVALLIASETSAFSFEALLVFLGEGASYLCEDRLSTSIGTVRSLGCRLDSPFPWCGCL